MLATFDMFNNKTYHNDDIFAAAAFFLMYMRIYHMAEIYMAYADWLNPLKKFILPACVNMRGTNKILKET